MKFTFLKLVGFKRLPLRDIEIFEHEFNSNLIMITGPNGSGKSSIFNELTPLPSDKNNFNKNGYKEIHIEKNNQKYKIISDFTSGSNFYFYVNDENLNIANNVTQQRELVFKHFGITQTIHNILIGVDTFTDMSLLNRKKLFNSITHLNIDKIIDNYNKLKEEYKNNELLLKTQVSLSLAEEQKLIDKDHLTNLLSSQSQIKEYLDLLLDIRVFIKQFKNDNDIDSSIKNYLNIRNQIKETINKYYTYLTSYPTDDKSKFTSKLEINKYRLSDFYSLLEKKQKEINILKLNQEQDYNSIKSELDSLFSKRDKIQNSITIFKDSPINIDDIRNELFKLEVSLVEIIRTIPLNINKKFSKDRYDNLLNRKHDILADLNIKIGKEAEINKDIEHISKHLKNLTCPKCSHTWSFDSSTESITNLKEEYKLLLESIVKLKNDIVLIDAELSELIEYFGIYKQYSVLRNATYNNLKPFWDIVDKGEYIFINPSYISSLFKSTVIEVEHLSEVCTINKRIQELNKNMEAISSIETNSVETIEDDIAEIIDEISILQIERDELNDNVKNNELAQSVYKLLSNSQTLLDSSMASLKDTNVSTTISEILNIVDSELSKYKVALIEIDTEINKYNNIKYTIDKYKKIIDDIQSNIKVLDLILEELSPKNGLIAKSVSSFLNIIIENINNIISSVWEYKMILKVINVEDEILNYKFKVEVEDKLPIDDISKCSAGMKKIINFSFVKLIYKLLNFDNYPLFLDEFTTNLDSTHTNKFAQLINQLSMTETYSQIFVISHINNDFYFSNKKLDIIDLGN